MNQNMQPGRPHVAPAPPFHPHPGQRQDYHAYPHPMPQSPHHHPYAAYGLPPQYYMPPPGPPPHYAAPRWQPPYHQQYMMPPPPHQQPPQHMPYQPRSPVVVSSSHYPPPVTRHTPVPPPHMMHPVSQSPRPIPQYAPPQVHTPVAPASPAPAPLPQQAEVHEQAQEPEPVQEQEQQQEVEAVPQQEATPPSQPQSRRQSVPLNPLLQPPVYRMPFYPKLPCYFGGGGAAMFPERASGRRRTRPNLHDLDAVTLPARDAVEDEVSEEQLEAPASEISTIAAHSEQETPATSQAPSESDYPQPSPPTSAPATVILSPKATPKQSQAQHARRDTRTAIAVPNIPGLARAKPSPTSAERLEESVTPHSEKSAAATTDEQRSEKAETSSAVGEEAAPIVPPKEAPKSWADLVRRNVPAAASGVPNGGAVVNGAALPRSASLTDALKQYGVQNDVRLSFLEPRGLVNTGNMCYMNSILQVLVFCTPFYTFLEQVRQRTVHSMKSATPLVDAMIMFMREFKVIASADSVDILRALLSQPQLEQYGDPVTPQYVYDAIAKLDRFNSMRRGHQQDAEEFLGFLLEGLHDECVTVMRGQVEEKPDESTVTSPLAVKSPTSTDGWLEVGPKQRASTTRTAGQEDAPSPVTKIFGGFLRSVLRVPGLKDSVTLEPYKPLQLDIGASHINNITDALKGITRTESLTGDFGGKANSARKQVFIDSLPPVLILHLKRFQYENNHTGTQKIWKKVGYPLELEIPKEVFPPGSRGGIAAKGGLPKYRLISVVYHHGKSAAGGHYTVDVLREDYREWMRMDDTVIRRIRPEDVAEGGSEEDPKLLAKALEQHKADQEMQRQRNMYQGLDEAEQEPEEEKPWSEVNGHTPGHRKWSSVANANVNTNGTATPVSGGKRTPTARKEGVRDNKVAYILLYERIRG